MTQTTLIANGTIVTAEGEFAGDVLIDGEQIAAVGRITAPEGTTVVDADGCFVSCDRLKSIRNVTSPIETTSSCNRIVWPAPTRR